MAGPDSANKFPVAESPVSALVADGAADDLVLIEHVAEIRRLGIRAKEDIIEIGRRLADAKKRVGHGRWLKWLDHNLGWCDKSAQRFINVYEFSQAEIFKYDKLSNLTLPVSAIYLMAQPSTPGETCAEIVEHVRAGANPPVAEVKATIEAAKGGKRPRNSAKTTGREPKPALRLVHSRDDIAPSNVGELVHADKDARIAELESEVRRLERELAWPRQAQIKLEDALRLRDIKIVELESEVEEQKAAASDEKLLGEFKSRLLSPLFIKKHRAEVKATALAIIAALGSPEPQADPVPDPEAVPIGVMHSVHNSLFRNYTQISLADLEHRIREIQSAADSGAYLLTSEHWAKLGRMRDRAAELKRNSATSVQGQEHAMETAT